MNILLNSIEKADTIAIAGHLRPDGDCIGSCMGLYSYIKDNYPEKPVYIFPISRKISSTSGGKRLSKNAVPPKRERGTISLSPWTAAMQTGWRK